MAYSVGSKVRADAALLEVFSDSFIEAAREDWVRTEERSSGEDCETDFRLFVYAKALGIILNAMDLHPATASDQDGLSKVAMKDKKSA
jgi:hypothetical protein